jgi:hypothetical protein
MNLLVEFPDAMTLPNLRLESSPALPMPITNVLFLKCLDRLLMRAAPKPGRDREGAVTGLRRQETRMLNER